jgi:hypothetical protein
MLPQARTAKIIIVTGDSSAELPSATVWLPADRRSAFFEECSLAEK